MDTLSAFQRSTVYNAALDYHDIGLSVIPCTVEKRPVIHWQPFQRYRSSYERIEDWFRVGRHFLTHDMGKAYQSIGVVCGAVSGGLVVVDLDGVEAVRQFYAALPHYSGKTLTILTGSEEGIHLYFFVAEMPDNLNVRTDAGGFELRGEGQYVIAPPSPHPSGNRYRVIGARNIAQVKNLDDISEYFRSLRARSTAPEPTERVSVQADQRKVAYLETVVSSEYARVEQSSEGERNNSLFYAGLRLANLAAGGELTWTTCESGLLSAARRAGLPDGEAQKTIASAWNIGKKYPKQVRA